MPGRLRALARGCAIPHRSVRAVRVALLNRVASAELRIGLPQPTLRAFRRIRQGGHGRAVTAWRTCACLLVAVLALVSVGAKSGHETTVSAAPAPCPERVAPRPGRGTFAPNAAGSSGNRDVSPVGPAMPRDPHSSSAVATPIVPAAALPRPLSVAYDDTPPMMQQIKEIFISEGVPPELVWIAEVESMLDPRAKSRAGALGLFQFTRDTAERFGMRTGRNDERLDPVKSARAAAWYLKSLHGRFGSWPLAVAAYNAGEARVAGSLRRRRATTYDDVAALLPYETRDYVPRVMAIVGAREGIDPHSLPPPRG